MPAHAAPSRTRRAWVAPAVLVTSLLTSAAWAPWAGAAPKGCKGRNCTTADTTRPTVAITEPAAGATVAGTVTVRGTASDNAGVSRVDVSVDGQAPVRATGTTGWSLPVDTTRYANGTRTVTATAVDTSGNASTTNLSLSVQNTVATPPPPPPPSGDALMDDVVVQDPKATHNLVLLGRGNIATSGTREVLLYWEEWTMPSRIVARVRDTATGATSLVDLPPTSGAWTSPSLVLTPAGDLWVLSGDAPVYLRQYRLSGSPMPTSATLVSSRTFGDSDSRMGALTQLASGAIVAVWHQQGQSGSEGHGIAYRRPDGSWQEQFKFWAFTRASRDSLAQHPADGTVWLFNSADAWGSIGAAHFTEVSGGLRLDWSDNMFIGSDEGQFDADPAFPDIVAVADAAAGDLVLAYQSAVRKSFALGVIGSYPAIARVRADGQRSFTHLPVWVERSLPLALSVRSGEVWLVHRVVDTVALTSEKLEVRVLRAGTWSSPQALGAAGVPIGVPQGGSFAFNGSDGALHALALG